MISNTSCEKEIIVTLKFHKAKEILLKEKQSKVIITALSIEQRLALTGVVANKKRKDFYDPIINLLSLSFVFSLSLSLSLSLSMFLLL
jgi:hypothetical protein